MKVLSAFLTIPSSHSLRPAELPAQPAACKFNCGTAKLQQKIRLLVENPGYRAFILGYPCGSILRFVREGRFRPRRAGCQQLHESMPTGRTSRLRNRSTFRRTVTRKLGGLSRGECEAVLVAPCGAVTPKMKAIVETLGWGGGVLTLTAYWLLSVGKLNARSAPYHLMNVLGAAAFIANCGWNGALPSVAANAVWMGIGIRALLRPSRDMSI